MVKTLSRFHYDKDAAGHSKNSISQRQILKPQLIIGTHLSENWVKSAKRSHIRRPLRAAFAEYTGPIPFFVVPRLDGHQDREGGEGKKKSNLCVLHVLRVHIHCDSHLHLGFSHIVNLCSKVNEPRSTDVPLNYCAAVLLNNTCRISKGVKAIFFLPFKTANHKIITITMMMITRSFLLSHCMAYISTCDSSTYSHL